MIARSLVLLLATLPLLRAAPPPVPPCAGFLPASCLPSPPPNSTVKLVALGVGTQNYSCTAAVPTSRGAVASLFDVTSQQLPRPCAGGGGAAPASQHDAEIGRHYFTRDLVPTFDVGKAQTPFVFSATKAAAVPAPDYRYHGDKDSDNSDGNSAAGAVDWLYLLPSLATPNAGAIRAAYRVRTAGGVPVSPCTGEQQVPYKAEYWFFG